MKSVAIALSLVVAGSGVATSAGAVGCLSGAVVGGVAAHVTMHKHALLGAAAGCAVGHHMAVMKKRKQAEQRREAAMAAHQH
jgi:hypothetical protein